jgi:DNA polymerase-3 subunit epsilon/exodeoxyribonuclease X
MADRVLNLERPLVALDLEGSGAQDHDNEDILEIAVIPITGGHPAIASAYTTVINPDRPIPHRPWISPGLTSDVLAAAPGLAAVAPELTARLEGKIIVGHNVGVDWRLLHRRCPAIHPSALIDTLRLARHVHAGTKGNGLTTLLDRHHLTGTVTALAPGSQPHRALWDTLGTALLLAALIDALPGDGTLTTTELNRIAGYPGDATRKNLTQAHPEQTSLPGI